MTTPSPLEKALAEGASLIQINQLPALPARKKNSHKNDFGHVLVIGGDQGYLGAALLAAKSALYTGAGLASVATQADHAALIAIHCHELMSHGVESASDVSPLIDKASVLAVGPGTIDSPWAIEMISTALSSQKPMVVDAGALRYLAAHPASFDNWILTPHPGEAAALLNCTVDEVQKNRVQSARNLQSRYGGTVILKGEASLICSENQLAVCPFGNPGMATAGTGDVLTGVCASFLAQGLVPHDAAVLATSLHALAGDELSDDIGELALTASQLLPTIQKLAASSSIK